MCTSFGGAYTKVAAERLDEMQDPELSIDRALEQYLTQSMKSRLSNGGKQM